MSKLSESQKEEINEMIAKNLFVDLDKVNLESVFVNDLGADSLDKVALIMEIEIMFDISIPDDEADEVHKVSELYEIVERHIQ